MMSRRSRSSTRDSVRTFSQSYPQKQFKLTKLRRLALLKHPDRPGGSNEAFSIINHAHDMLTDPDKKRKYDADFNRRNRTAHASGVRGNPWATAGNQWAPPPRPHNFPSRPAPTTQKRQPSTAEKFAEMAGSARRPPPRPTEANKNSQWQAWDHIRMNKHAAAGQNMGSGSSSRPASGSRPAPPPPPVPPRAAPQKQPKGSFGARVQKNGYIPESPGDEGAHSKDNYFTTRTHSSLFNETSTAARARRRAPPSPPNNGEDHNDDDVDDDDDDGLFPGVRHSTPYQTHGGEKFDSWNGASHIGRSRSTRDPNRQSYANDNEKSVPNASTRQRSSSIPNVADNLPQGAQSSRNGQRAASTTPASGGYQKSPKDSDPSHDKEDHQLYAKQSPFSSAAPIFTSAASSAGSAAPFFSSTAPPLSSTAPFKKATQNTQPSRAPDQVYNKQTRNLSPVFEELVTAKPSKSSSEDESPIPRGLNGFEQKLSSLLQELSTRKWGSQEAIIGMAVQHSKTSANGDNNSFGSQARTPTDSHRFTRNSTDNINTRFVAEGGANYQFSAGSPVAEDGRPAMPRNKSGSRVGRPPFSAQAPQNAFPQPSNVHSAQNGSFNPAEWSEKIDPSIFEAPTPQKTPVPSGRPMRKPSKKPVRMTAGTAGMVDLDESSSGQDDIYKDSTASNRASGVGINGSASPTPMDVDPPVHNVAVNGVRNIPVTPSRPEWRAGDVGLGIKVDAKPVGGSEDTDEFKASFADLRNVEPFAERASGLDSFGDLRSNLPFTSAASGQVPVRKPVAHKAQHVDLPMPPKPPASPAALGPNLGLKPSAATWKKYMDNFAQYMEEWHVYNARFIDHFAARKVQLQQKLSSLDWISSKDDAGLAEYNSWEEQDHLVRDEWTAACNNHEIHMRSFMINRQKMMK